MLRIQDAAAKATSHYHVPTERTVALPIWTRQWAWRPLPRNPPTPPRLSNSYSSIQRLVNTSRFSQVSLQPAALCPDPHASRGQNFLRIHSQKAGGGWQCHKYQTRGITQPPITIPNPDTATPAKETQRIPQTNQASQPSQRSKIFILYLFNLI